MSQIRTVRRRPPRTRYWARQSESVAANDFESIINFSMEDGGTLMGARLSMGLTLASAGVSKAEAWLVHIRGGASSFVDPTVDADAGYTIDMLGFWECHLSDTTPFNVNENINVRRRYNKDDSFILYAKSASGFDIEAQLLLWVAE